jgi:hypothetical protein
MAAEILRLAQRLEHYQGFVAQFLAMHFQAQAQHGFAQLAARGFGGQFR